LAVFFELKKKRRWIWGRRRLKITKEQPMWDRVSSSKTITLKPAFTG